jgi:cytochrome c-type biogenesis protein CcmH
MPHLLASVAAVALLALLTSAVIPALAQPLDDQVREIASRLMCPVCEGRPVAESNSELAGQMRALIREKLRAGASPEQIVAYFVDRYGESALAAPPRRGLGLVAWLAPVLATVAGALFLIVRFRGGVPSNPQVPPLSAEEQHRLRRLLGDGDLEDGSQT